MSVMREIKFRAWWEGDEGYKIVGQEELQHLDNDDFCVFNIMTSSSERSVGDNTAFMEYTGLNDINGKEIYESDIVRCRLGEHWNYKETIGTVLFHCGEWALEEKGSMFFKIKLYRCKEIEIIGNIYENPELLCEEKI